MKIPHRLVLARSGRWHFRRRIPADLVEVLQRKFIRKSLGTSSLTVAQVRALAVNAQCLSTFAALRGRMTSNKPPRSLPADDDDGARFDYTVRIELPNVFVDTDGTEDDHARAMEALHALQPLLSPQAPAAPRASPVKGGITLSEASKRWLLTLPGTVRPKTEKIMRCAIEGFVEGRHDMLVANIGRTDVSDWIQVLRQSKIATPTIVNKMSYLTRFFRWAIGAGHYPSRDNPAQGQIQYGKREKKLRTQFAWRPLTLDEIQILYASANFAQLSSSKRWASLLILYTGARVSEIGQLAVSDIVDVEGMTTIRITDEKPGQSLKTASSSRLVPLHPDLVQLGFLAYVAALRERDEEWLFPTLKTDSVNGRGNSFSSAFTRYVAKVLPPPPDDRKIGFHSLRKSVIQRMQDGRVHKEHRMQYSGHEQDDVHHTTYSRRCTPAELAAEIHPALKFGLDISSLKGVLERDPLRRRSTRLNRRP